MRTAEQPRVLAAAIVLLLLTGIAAAQRRPEPGTPSSQRNVQGSLTVTFTIASSVGVVVDQHGQQHLAAANTVDPADNVSQIRYVQLTPVEKESQKQPEKIRKEKLPAQLHR